MLKYKLGLVWLFLMHLAIAKPVQVVAAENFYAQLAQEIGGNSVHVSSILNNPMVDPHLFTTTSATNKLINQAQIIIYNGANYDSWMTALLGNKPGQVIINVAQLMQIKNGANPHIWYNPATFVVLAKELARQLIKLEPSAKGQIQANLSKFMLQHQQVTQQIALLRTKYAGIKVTATEPLYGYMAQALGLIMCGEDLQWKIMNDSEPSPKMLANYQRLLIQKQVKILFYNEQVSSPLTTNLKQLAQKNAVLTMGLSEMMPKNTQINQWFLTQLNELATLLAKLKHD